MQKVPLHFDIVWCGDRVRDGGPLSTIDSNARAGLFAGCTNLSDTPQNTFVSPRPYPQVRPLLLKFGYQCTPKSLPPTPKSTTCPSNLPPAPNIHRLLQNVTTFPREPPTTPEVLHLCQKSTTYPREIGNLLPNNRRQRRTCYALCHILYPVSAAHTSILRMDSNSTSYTYPRNPMGALISEVPQQVRSHWRGGWWWWSRGGGANGTGVPHLHENAPP